MMNNKEKKFYDTLMNGLLISIFFCGAWIVELAHGDIDYLVGGVAVLGPFCLYCIRVYRRKKQVVQ